MDWDKSRYYRCTDRGLAYRISAYRCAIARIGIGQIIADTFDYKVAHAQTIYSTDQMQVITLTRLHTLHTRSALRVNAFIARHERVYR